MIGVAALSLAACGSGGGESTDPARLSAVEDREKRVASREAAVSQKEKDQAAKDRQQAAKDVAQAAKDRELNNRPPRVVTRTVTRTAPPSQTAPTPPSQQPPAGPTHVGFSGGNFSSDEINGLANMSLNMQDDRIPMISFIDSMEDPRIAYSNIVHWGLSFPKAVPSQGNSLALKFYKVEAVKYETRDQNLDFRDGSLTTNDGWKIFDVASPTDITSLGLSDTFTYKLFKGEVDPRRTDTPSAADDSKFHAEVATDYASDNTSDYLQFGWWVLVPKQTGVSRDYNFGVFADANYLYNIDGSQWTALTGTVTYVGSMMGLHTEQASNGKMTLSRLTGKATLTVNFGSNSAEGSLAGTFNELKLNGTAKAGSITFTYDDIVKRTSSTRLGTSTINGNTYQGGVSYNWIGSTESKVTTRPSGILGTLKGVTDDGSKAFAAAFGAREE